MEAGDTKLSAEVSFELLQLLKPMKLM